MISSPAQLPLRAALMPLAAGFCGLVIAMGVSRFAYNPLLPGMMAQHGFNEVVAGAMASWNYIGYLMGALAARGVSSPVSRHRFFLLCMAVNVLSIAIMSEMRGEFLWYATRWLAGVSGGAIFVLASAMVFDELAVTRRPGLAGFLYSGVGTGIALSGMLAPFFEARYGNDAAWLGLGLVCLLPAVFSGIFIKPSQKVLLTRVSAGKGIGVTQDRAHQEDRRRKTARLVLLLAYFLEGLGYIISATFLVTMVKSSTGSTTLANASWVLTGLTAACLTPLWALAGQRIGHRKALILAFAAQAVGVVLPVLSSSPAAALCSGVLFGGTFLGITVLSLQYSVVLSDASSTQAISTMTVVYGTGQIIAPIVAGYLAKDGAGFASSFILSAAFVALGGAVLLLGPERSKKNGG